MEQPIVFRPALKNLMALPFLVIAPAFGTLYGFMCFKVSIDFLSDSFIFSLVLFISSVLIVLVSFFLLFCGLWYYGSKCRRVSIDKEGIQRGLLCPVKICWKEVAAIGTAPLSVNISKDGRASRSELSIYLTDSNSCCEEIRKYGILQIWTWMCIKKYVPFLTLLFSGLEKKSGPTKVGVYHTGEKMLLPKKIIWIRFDHDMYQMLYAHFLNASGQGDG